MSVIYTLEILQENHHNEYSLSNLAKPKSHSLTVPFFVTSMFSGFTSLCIHCNMKQRLVYNWVKCQKLWRKLVQYFLRTHHQIQPRHALW